MSKMIEIVKLDIKHCDALAEIMSTDTDLYGFLSTNPNQPVVSPTAFFDVCRAWEAKKNGVTFSILADGVPIGTISYIHEDEQTASVGMWITSAHWNSGHGRLLQNLPLESHQFKHIFQKHRFQRW